VASINVDLTGVLRPVRQGNAFEETVERLLTVIKLGLLGPGQRFPPERELAAQLGISRLTLRDAIRELQQAGYVESRRGRFGGTFITYRPPAPDTGELLRLAREDGDKLTDALTFRLALETGAAEVLATLLGQRQARGRSGHEPPVLRPVTASARAAGTTATAEVTATAAASLRQRAPAASRSSLAPGQGAQKILLARLADVNDASPQDYRRLDTLFHLSIAERTGSSLLAAACADARMRLNDLLNAIPVLQRNILHAGRQHTAIVEAILAGNPEGARRAVAEHLEGTAALLRGFLA
jgi:DNA-binding FadR family transcriptional regulator